MISNASAATGRPATTPALRATRSAARRSAGGTVAIQAGQRPPGTAPAQVAGEWLPDRSPAKIVLLVPSVTVAIVVLLLRQNTPRPPGP